MEWVFIVGLSIVLCLIVGVICDCHGFSQGMDVEEKIKDQQIKRLEQIHDDYDKRIHEIHKEYTDALLDKINELERKLYGIQKR